jgi:hypothetical protein
MRPLCTQVIDEYAARTQSESGSEDSPGSSPVPSPQGSERSASHSPERADSPAHRASPDIGTVILDSRLWCRGCVDVCCWPSSWAVLDVQGQLSFTRSIHVRHVSVFWVLLPARRLGKLHVWFQTRSQVLNLTQTISQCPPLMLSFVSTAALIPVTDSGRGEPAETQPVGYTGLARKFDDVAVRLQDDTDALQDKAYAGFTESDSDSSVGNGATLLCSSMFAKFQSAYGNDAPKYTSPFCV